MPETVFCYHCATHHPVNEMRQILTKSGKRWRCVKSIEATKVGLSKRDAFGQQVKTDNKADAHARIRRMGNPERNRHS